jgi:hypothetical protein
VNRRFMLGALLAIILAACGTDQSAESTVTPTPEPPEATPEPTESPEETDGGGTGSLDDLIPDELNGVAATSIPGAEAMLNAALQGQGMDAGEVEFAFVTYGTGADAIVLNAFNIPGASEVDMQSLAQVMSGISGGQSGMEAEEVTVGGKSVLSFTGTGAGVVYFYVADQTAFTIAGQDQALVEQLLADLP